MSTAMFGISSNPLYAPDWDVRPAPVCPVCTTPARWFDVVDFNKNRAEATGFFLPLSGGPVYYARCENREFCFAPELHHWSAQEMAHRVYNADYLSVDPDGVEARPQESAQQLVRSKKLTLEAWQVRRQYLCQLVFSAAHRVRANLAGVGATPDPA